MKKPKGGGKGGKGAKEKKWYDDVAQFSDATTDSDAVDLDAMTPEERERYLAERAVRRADREKKRREKYGAKYDEMAAAKHAWVSLSFAVFTPSWINTLILYGRCLQYTSNITLLRFPHDSAGLVHQELHAYT